MNEKFYRNKSFLINVAHKNVKIVVAISFVNNHSSWSNKHFVENGSRKINSPVIIVELFDARKHNGYIPVLS